MTTAAERSSGGGRERETFKGGWLKRMSPVEKRHSVIEYFHKQQKAEKVWVSFCVHEETEPFLEFYDNRRSAYSHNPSQRISLLRCVYVSPKISRSHDEASEHVFAVTLTHEEPIKLGAHSREVMMEWIDVLRYKLREMGILTPKDNPYSKEPEGISPLLRNPNSPLPPTPTFQSTSFDFRGKKFVIRTQKLASHLPNDKRQDEEVTRNLLSPAPSLTLSTGSGMSLQSLNSVASDPNTSPSAVVTYVRPNHEPAVVRRSSFRVSLPNSPTTTFVRSTPQVPSSREHVTVISVSPSGSDSIFNFEGVSAALESSAPAVPAELYGGSHSGIDVTSEQDPSSFSDPNAVQLRVGNSLGAMGHTVGRPPRPPSQRSCNHVNAHSGGWNNMDESAYEPLFLATTEEPSLPQPPIPQAPHTGLMRRRSEHRRSGRRSEHGRRAASVGPSIVPKPPYQVGSDGRLMSLREQQVIRLQREIAHQAGVRLTLRKKDCVDSIALVNCYSQVYVAGWKQREHPYLHNTFHLGDRIVSVCAIQVSSASEVQNIIKNEPGLMVEFIIRRVPHGRVYNIKREMEGQPLGLVRDDNSAEIKDVIPGSLASQHGIPSRSHDGQTPWTLTEINHRPLNLFFKHSEVTERLNAVGRDISILIQPANFVRQLKKQLKLIKCYKEYIVM